MAIPATQLRPGMIIKHNNDLHSVFSVEHRTPGNLRAFIQAKLRNLRTGAMFEQLIELSSRFPVDVDVSSDVTKYQQLAGPQGDVFLSSHRIVVWSRATPAAAGVTANLPNPPSSSRCPTPAPDPSRQGRASNAELVVGSMRTSFRGCYKNELQARATAEGHMRMTGKIGADGGVVEVALVSSGFSTAMAECMGTQFLAAKFSPPDGGGASIVIPVTFALEGHPSATRLPF